MVTGSRAWWVRTNTGWWNGGSSPHQLAFGFGSSSQGPCPPLNIRRPTTVAPVLRAISARTSLSTPVSPPAPPCRSRNAAVATAQSCSFSPPTPSGSSSDGLGPATNPSSDTDRSNLSLPIMPSSQECAAKATGAASALSVTGGPSPPAELIGCRQRGTTPGALGTGSNHRGRQSSRNRIQHLLATLAGQPSPTRPPG